VAIFLVEGYAPAAATVADIGRRARAVADEAARAGLAVRYLHSIFVPEDEMCFHLVEARSAEAVRALTWFGGFSPDRIVEAHTWYDETCPRPSEQLA
jgi:hypothetical protein